MNRSEVLKGLQTHKKYSKMSQKDITEKLGGIDNLRTELSRLENQPIINQYISEFKSIIYYSFKFRY